MVIPFRSEKEMISFEQEFNSRGKLAWFVSHPLEIKPLLLSALKDHILETSERRKNEGTEQENDWANEQGKKRINKNKNKKQKRTTTSKQTFLDNGYEIDWTSFLTIYLWATVLKTILVTKIKQKLKTKDLKSFCLFYPSTLFLYFWKRIILIVICLLSVFHFINMKNISKDKQTLAELPVSFEFSNQ